MKTIIYLKDEQKKTFSLLLGSKLPCSWLLKQLFLADLELLFQNLDTYLRFPAANVMCCSVQHSCWWGSEVRAGLVKHGTACNCCSLHVFNHQSLIFF